MATIHPHDALASAPKFGSWALVVDVPRSGLIGALAVVWVVLIGASALQDVVIALGLGTRRIWMLDVEVESGLYTWFSTLLLAGAALVCGIVALQKRAAGDRLRYH